MYELLIKNGIYPDFESSEMKKANIALKDGKIAWIGDVNEIPEAMETIDVADKIVSPGFIDIHMHEENFRKEGKKYVIANMMLEMGVTTAVGGNCGVMYQPLKEFKTTLKELGGSPVNYIMLAGYNQYRTELGLGRYEKPTEAQKDEIKEILKRELNEGAWGVSFGIEYDPGIDLEEMTYAAQVIEEPDMLVSAHVRSDGPEAISSIEEALELSRKIPAKFQISHLSSCAAMGQMRDCLKLIEEEHNKNLKLNYDTYPYNAFSTTIGSSVFEDGCLEGWGKTYSDIMLTDDPYRNVICTKEIFEDARANYPEMLAVAQVMNEDEISMAISNPIMGMVASDAIINNGNGHPRCAGTFPRILGKYVREEKALKLIDALRKMTLEPAKHLGIEKTKGQINVGMDADITIFDPERIKDKADFSHIEKPEGIELVLIGGKTALKDGNIIDGRCGKFISWKSV